ncbi:hypothetical protein [Streptomyces spiralis]
MTRCLFQWSQDGLRVANEPTTIANRDGWPPAPRRYRMRFR